MSGPISVASLANAVSTAVLSQNPTLPKLDSYKIVESHAKNGYVQLTRNMIGENNFSDEQKQDLEKTAAQNGTAVYTAKAISYFNKGDLPSAYLLITQAEKNAAVPGVVVSEPLKKYIADLKKTVQTNAKKSGVELESPPLEPTDESQAIVKDVLQKFERGDIQAARYFIQRNSQVFASLPEPEKLSFIELSDKGIKNGINIQIEMAAKQPPDAAKYLLDLALKSAKEEGTLLTKEQKDRINDLNVGIKLK